MTQEKPNPGGNDFWEQALSDLDTSGLHGMPPIADRIISEVGSNEQKQIHSALRNIYRPLEDYLKDQVAYLVENDAIPGVTTEIQKSRFRVRSKKYSFSVKKGNSEERCPASLRVEKLGDSWVCREYTEDDQAYALDTNGRVSQFQLDLIPKGKIITGDAIEKLFGYETRFREEISVVRFSFNSPDQITFAGFTASEVKKKPNRDHQHPTFRRTVGEKGELVDERGNMKRKDCVPAIQYLFACSELAHDLNSKQKNAEEAQE